MFDPNKINDIVKNLLSALPAGVKDLPKDVEQTFKQVLSKTLSKMDLVTREEFDAQTKVLARTREKLEALEKRFSSSPDKRA